MTFTPEERAAFDGSTPGPWRVLRTPDEPGHAVQFQVWLLPGDRFSTALTFHEPDARLIAAAPRLLEELEKAEARVKELEAHILDIDAHATPYGDIPGEPGWVGRYLLSAGALHRALGKIGHSAPSCEAEARVKELEEGLQRVAGRMKSGVNEQHLAASRWSSGSPDAEYHRGMAHGIAWVLNETGLRSLLTQEQEAK